MSLSQGPAHSSPGDMGHPQAVGRGRAARGSRSGESGRSGLRAGAWGGTPGEPASDFLPGTFPKPIIWAEPSSVVPLGSSVTILCQGPPNTKSFSLNKEGDSTPWNIHPSLEPWDKANFFISNVREQQAGRYHCSHFIGVNWSEPSEPLDLLVAGEEPAGQSGTTLCTGPTGEPQGWCWDQGEGSQGGTERRGLGRGETWRNRDSAEGPERPMESRSEPGPVPAPPSSLQDGSETDPPSRCGQAPRWPWGRM